jgi:hypothetical protein
MGESKTFDCRPNQKVPPTNVFDIKQQPVLRETGITDNLIA